MSNTNTGGPAFPCDPFAASEPNTVAEAKRLAEGMTLRDYFAAKAMQGSRSRNSQYESWNHLAKDAWDIADAMLKAREV